MDRLPMTQNGYDDLVKELDDRKNVKRPEIIKSIQDARAHGDLSENAEYKEAKNDQSFNEGRITELEDKIGRAEIIDVASIDGDTIKFGATVTLEDLESGFQEKYQLVGADEADTSQGRISITSPVAKALIGKTEGSECMVILPNGNTKEYEVLKIEYI